jgi:CheY-like chemotaxis protein
LPKPLRIVVADDDAELLEYYAQLVPHLGYVLLAQASNGLDLVDSCRGCRPDLVVTDIQMPGLDGISAMRVVQGETDIPFILVSADDLQHHRQSIAQSQVLSYLQKPVQQHQLATALQAACQVITGKSRDGSMRDRL